MSTSRALLAVVFLVGCPGEMTAPDAGRTDGGSDAGPASTCGDGVLDDGEECDDANAVAFDGCEPSSCTFTCVDTADCDDLDPCSGAESCTDHSCVPGTALADSSACTTESITEGDCRGSRCVAVTCGDGARDDAEACDDGNTTAGDGCEPDCTFSCPGTDLDADGDGFASTDLGACGTDCDDTDPAVFPGAAELCDGIDNNCNTDVDETRPTWFVDCDVDGFAANSDGSMQACEEPPAIATGCTSAGRWTTRRPADPATTDCNDGNANMFPGQSMYFAMQHSSGTTDTARFGNYNCNGTVEYDHSTVAVTTSSSCTPATLFGRVTCSGTDGWTSGTRTCGSIGTYSDCTGTSGAGSPLCDHNPSCRTVCPDDVRNPLIDCDCTPGARGCALECLCCGRESSSGEQMRCR